MRLARAASRKALLLFECDFDFLRSKAMQTFALDRAKMKVGCARFHFTQMLERAAFEARAELVAALPL